MIEVFPTVAELKKTIEIMREVYPFDDDARFNPNAQDIRSAKGQLEIITTDKETGTLVILNREYFRECVDNGNN